MNVNVPVLYLSELVALAMGHEPEEIGLDMHRVGVEPFLGHKIQGLKNMNESIVPAIYDPSKIHEQIMVETEDAFAMTRRVVKEEGIFAGMSSGAAMCAAAELAREISSGVIVLIFISSIRPLLTPAQADDTVLAR